MKLLRETIRRILVEENRKALDGDQFWGLMENMVSKKLESMGGVIDHFETDVLNDIKFVGEWYYDGIEKDQLLALENYFTDYVEKRGWNMLRYKVETSEWMVDGSGRVIINCDMQPNPKSSNLNYSMKDLVNEGFILLHVTPSKNVQSILSGGFKPSRVSSDGIKFGGQRNFFFIIDEGDWKASKEEILEWFQTTFGGEGRGSYAGIKSEDISLIVTNPWHLTNKKIRANFYIDTEFGYGDGTIDTSGYGWQMKAVYTPTHFVPVIPEVIQIAQSADKQ
tara:strand:- start:483 stop:1319 length:837 start_codon:yes stop_codon:yes gene_type:complete